MQLNAVRRTYRSPSTASRSCSASCTRVALTCNAATASTAPGFEAYKHACPDGKRLEVQRLAQRAASGAAASTSKPPILFVHGSYHGAWCWQENFMPYFAARGYDTYAVSLRAQGGSDRIDGAKVAGTLDVHAADLASLIATLGQPPVVVAHSFGGLILQKYVLGMTDGAKAGNPALAGAAFMCSVPHTGNKQLVMRFLRRDLWLSLRVTWGFIAKSFASSEAACRELFFSPDLPSADLRRYQAALAAGSPTRMIDLADMNKQVPLPSPPKHAPKAFVLGGDKDCVVDVEAVQELAAYYGVPPVVLPNMAHDCMLDTRWQQAAGSLERWLEQL